MAKKILDDLFELEEKLGEGGMGSVYKVKVNPQSTRYGRFLSNIVAWREAIGKESFSPSKTLHQANSTLDELTQKEMELQDQYAQEPTPKKRKILQKTKAQIESQKETRKESIQKLREEQSKYAQERTKELLSKKPEDLIDLMQKRGIYLPADLSFALKTIPLSVTKRQDNMNSSKRLQEEARSLISLTNQDGNPHPNIVTLFTFGKNYYVMEHVGDQISPQKIIDSFSVGEIIETTIKAAHGLDCAHKHGVIHRDIKPSNIFVTPSLVKVGDFGLAKRRDVGFELTQSGATMGTPHYMSPEQVENTKYSDERSDIYSLGATLYHLLVGQKPFEDRESSSLYELAQIITEEEITPASEYGIAPELSEIISSMTSKKPSERPQKMEEVVELLEQYKQIEDVNTLQTVTLNNLPSRKKKRFTVRKRADISTGEISSKSFKKWYLIGGTAGVLALGALGVFLFGGDDEPVVDNNDKPVAQEKDFSHINKMFSALEDNYSPQKHQKLVKAVNEVPEAKKEEFESLLEKADLLEDDYELDRFNQAYESLSRDPTTQGITNLKDKYEELDKKPEDVDFDGLSAIVSKYDKAKNLVDECKRLVRESEDMRYANEIAQKKKKVKELIEGTEQVKSYNEIVKQIAGIELGPRLTLDADFDSEEDLKYLKKILEAEGKIKNGHFVGDIDLEGICSFYFKGQIKDNEVEGHGSYDGKEIEIDKAYSTNHLEGQFKYLKVSK